MRSSRGSGVEGGLSSVYKATDLAQDAAPVALKMIGRPKSSDSLMRLAFDREVASLRALDHPNIVKFLDSGAEEQTGQFYIVLEWLPRSLNSLLESVEGWDDFATVIGLPLLRALSYAHEQDVVHRDVKPSNVLATEFGTPKLVDFGISKLKTTIDEDPRTLVDFGSGPYAPPDRGSASSPSRDVYGFAVLTLQSLTEVPIRAHDDIGKALDALDAPPRVLDLLGRCVADKAASRPESATVLFHELDSIQSERNDEWVVRPRVHISITARAAEMLASEGVDVRDPDARDTFIAAELNEGCHGLQKPDGTMVIVGSHWSFFAADNSGPYLTFVSALYRPGPALDRDRAAAAELEFEFSARAPTDYVAAAEALKHVRWAIDEHERAAAEARVAALRFRPFDQWESQLRAKLDFERRRQPPLPFRDAELHGQTAVFQLDEPPSADLQGQQWMVDRPDRRGPRFSGEVDSITDSELYLYLSRPPLGELPAAGRLVLDISQSRAAADRQLQALSSLWHGGDGLVRPDLAALVLDPSKSRDPQPVRIDEWVNRDLDDEKRTAVLGALGAQDFFVVTGPPGTGKTSFIAELASQIIRANEGARILVASQTHVAVDNALERIKRENPSLLTVRLGRADKVFLPSVKELLLEEQRDEWIAGVRSQSEAFIRYWAKSAGADLRNVRAALLIGEIVSARREARDRQADIDAVSQVLDGEAGEAAELGAMSRDEIDELKSQRAGRRDALRATKRRLDELTQEAATNLDVRASEIEAFDDEGLADLASACFGGSELADSAVRDAVLLQGEWLEQVGHGPEFDEAFLASASVVGATCVGFAGVKAASRLRFDVCIVDEASKATATEVLVPMVKADRWVLVGDQHQLPPFQDDAYRDPEIIEKFELDRDELKRTLFDRVAEHVRGEAAAFLGTQHRMAAGLGQLISECFYESRLATSEDAPRPLPAAVVGRPVTWLSTETIHERRERRAGSAGLSYTNPTEAAAVLRVLKAMNQRIGFLNQGTPETQQTMVSVLVLAGYLPQVSDIRRRVAPQRADLANLDIEVNTIDASQGREADVVIFSVVRSNEEGKLGFLEETTRINVALSRARRNLLIVGDASFAGGGTGPLDTVRAYMRRHPDTCEVVNLDDWA